MPKLILTLETVTPLLMNGATQTPEIRAASFRGVLRYWLRAVLGGVTQDPKILRDCESGIFGSTQCGSGVILRVRSDIVPTPNRELIVLPPTVYNHRKQMDIDFKHQGFRPGSTFDLEFHTHPLVPELPLLLTETLPLAFYLGSFGKRARRGAGSLRVIKVDDNDVVGTRWEVPADGSALRKKLAQLMIQARTTASTITKLPLLEKPTRRPRFPSFCEGCYRVLVDEKAYSLKAAYNQLWTTSGPYHHEGGAFGSDSPRRASAIHMKVAQSQAGYHPILTIFSSGKDSNWTDVNDFIHDSVAAGFVSCYD